MLNKEELISILKIENSTTFSNKDNDMISYIKERLTASNIVFEEQVTKISHNIFSIRDNKPLICCHTDSMKMTHDDVKKSKKTGFLPITVEENNTGEIVAFRGERRAILGGDDGCGIFILLNLIESGADISFAFFSNEECGMFGSRLFPKEKLATVPYGLVIDRMGNNNIICSRNNYGSEEFENALVEVGVPFGYKPERGFCSDADALREYISCANLSCGYYKTHSCQEYVIYNDVINTYNYVNEIIRSFDGRVFEKNSHLASAFIEEEVVDIISSLQKKFNKEYKFFASEENISTLMKMSIQ